MRIMRMTTVMASSSSASSSAKDLSRYRPTFFTFISSPASTVVNLSPMSLAFALLLLLTCQVPGLGGSTCPADAGHQANACFSSYNREFQNIRHSPKRLCCGVDVETLRAFCSSFVHAMSCIQPLKKQCPRSQDVQESVKKNLYGAESSLTSLCSDDTIIEKYALHQSCITRTGPGTERCLQRYLNTSDTIKLMTTVDTRHIAEFCSDMRGTLQCIQKHVRQNCGADASDLVTKLVKPMVRQSNKCNYNVVTKAPVSRQGQPSPSSHDGSWQNPSSGSGRPSPSSPSPYLSALLLVCVAACITRTVLCPSS